MSAGLEHADRLAREDALRRFDRHMILEAGAGTGKTTVLVERVLAWTLGPGYEDARRDLSPLRGRALEATEEDSAVGRSAASEVPPTLAPLVFSRLAALTFSEAAAAEMESRITGALRELAAGEAVPRVAAACGVAPATLGARAASLLDHCERLQVTTIHSFCRTLLASFPLEAGVAPTFEVDASGRAAGRASRREIEALLANASQGELDDLAALAVRGCGPAELEGLLRSLLVGAVEPRAFAADPLDPRARGALLDRLRGAMRSLAEAGLGEPALRSLALLETAAPASPSELDRVLAALRELWPAPLRARADRLPAKAEEAALLRHACAMDADCLARLHRLLAPRFARADAALNAAGTLGFDALLFRTRDLLRRCSTVASRLRGSLSQLLVDEFQDTDQVQCEIVELLALSSGGPTLFVVGDPKQSIYAWRSADLRAYDAFLTRLDRAGAQRHRLAVSHRSLPAILEEVERGLAPLMTRELGVQPAFQPLVASDAQRARCDAGGVEYWVAQATDDTGAPIPTPAAESLELETRALAQELWRLHCDDGVPWREVAILLRSTGELDRYLEALRRAEIPYAVDRDRVYFRRREVVDARALLRTVIDPNDDLAWVATLRSARCGVPDAAWVPLLREGAIDLARRTLANEPFAPAALADAVTRVARSVEGLPIPGLKALAGWEQTLLDLVDTLAALRRCFERDPFEVFLARARRLALFDLSEGARYLGRYRIANLDRLFRETADLYSASGGDLGQVLRELRRVDLPLPDGEESRPPGVGTDAVQVMTIHGAKGLDFGHVFLLQAHKTSARRSDEAFQCEWYGGELHYALRWGRRAGAWVSTPAWDRVAARRDAAARAEQVRTLYVAMTRAKTRLVVSGRLAEARLGAARSHADYLAPRLVGEAPAGVRRRVLGAESLRELSAGEAGGRGSAVLPRRSKARREDAWAYAARPYTLAASSAASAAAAAFDADRPVKDAATGPGAGIGTAIHAFLEDFDFDADDPWPKALAALRARLANRVPAQECGAAESAAREILERLREGPLWDRLRKLQRHVLGREVPLLARPARGVPATGPAPPDPSVDSESNTPVGAWIGAVDLLYRDPDTGELVVVDFKSDRVSDGAGLRARAAHYEPQGRVYCQAVADALGTAAPVRFELWFLALGRCVATRFELPATRAKPAHNLRGSSAELR